MLAITVSAAASSQDRRSSSKCAGRAQTQNARLFCEFDEAEPTFSTSYEKLGHVRGRRRTMTQGAHGSTPGSEHRRRCRPSALPTPTTARSSGGARKTWKCACADAHGGGGGGGGGAGAGGTHPSGATNLRAGMRAL